MPSHLAFAVIIITSIAILTVIAYAKSNKHKGLNQKFVPSGYTAIAFAANTIIWILTNNFIILILSLVISIFVAEGRIEAKEHKLSEIIFSAAIGTLLVLALYGAALAFMQI